MAWVVLLFAWVLGRPFQLEAYIHASFFLVKRLLSSRNKNKFKVL